MERKVLSSVAKTMVVSEKRRQHPLSGYVALKCTTSASQPQINLLCFLSVCGRKIICSDPDKMPYLISLLYVYLFTNGFDL